MKVATWNYIIVNYNGYEVNVPSPASYCLQKLLINKERSVEKRIKDIDAIRYLLGYVVASKKYKDELIDSYGNAPKKWKKAIKETMTEYALESII